MVQIAEIRDHDSLKAYLDGLPYTNRLITARRVAHFAAMSVVPVALRFFVGNPAGQKRDVTALPIFGCLATSGVASTTPTPYIHGRAAAYAAYAAADAAYVAYAYADDAAAYADAAADAAYAAAAADADADADADAADAAAAASRASDGDFWLVLRDFLQNQPAPDAPRLGPITLAPKIADDWTATRTALQADRTCDWTFWIVLFDRMLAGKDIHPTLLAPILNEITEGEWQGAPSRVTKRFDAVLEVYLLDDQVFRNPYGHSAKINSETDKLVLVTTDVVDLDDVILNARRFLRDFNRRCKNEGGHNQLGLTVKAILETEIARLKRNLKKFEKDPQSLYNDIIRQTKHMRRLLAHKEYADFPAAQSLIDDLETLPSEICLVSEPVRAAAAKRVELQIEQATDAAMAMAALACHGLEGDGEGQMRFFAAYAKKVLLNPKSDIEEKKVAWTFAKEITVRAAREVTVQNALDPKKKTTIGQRLKNTTDVAVTLDKLGDIGQEAYVEGWLAWDTISKWIPGL